MATMTGFGMNVGNSNANIGMQTQNYHGGHHHGYHQGYYGGDTNMNIINGGNGFDLKPQHDTRYGVASANQIGWTYDRTTVPPQLASRGVSQSLWGQTHDAVEGMHQNKIDAINGLLKEFCLFIIPCYAIPRAMHYKNLEMQLRNDWVELAQNTNRKYERYGVHVTVVKEFQASGVGSHRHLSPEMVGLRFELLPLGSPPQQQQTTSAVTPTTPMAPVHSGEDVAKQLDTLNQLYQTGALTAEEFASAKAEVLKKF